MAYVKPPRLDPAAGQSARHEAKRPRRGYYDPGRPPNRRDPQGARHPRRGRRERLSGIAYGESDWVRNLRAAGQGELSRKGRTEAFHAVEVPAGQRGPVVARYREATGHVVGPVFAKLPEARDHPVFRIDSNPGR